MQYNLRPVTTARFVSYQTYYVLLMVTAVPTKLLTEHSSLLDVTVSTTNAPPALRTFWTAAAPHTADGTS